MGGAAGGLTFFAPSEERLESGLYSKSYLENQMAVALGGRIAEELIFGSENVTTGASGDFQQVTRTAKMMITQGLQRRARAAELRRRQRPVLPRPGDGSGQRLQRGDGGHYRQGSEGAREPGLQEGQGSPPIEHG